MIKKMETKKCIKCGIEKTLDNFTFRKETGKYRGVCHECRRKKYREDENYRQKALKRAKEFYQKNREKELALNKKRYEENLSKMLWASARTRAREKNLPFDITPEDIVIPKYCPVFGFELKIRTKDRMAAPSIDRIIPEKGYVKGNIIVVSFKANTMKSNATLEEIKQLYDFYSKIIK